MIPDLSPPLAWRKSSYSGGENGNCVEVAEVTEASYVRDTKNRSGDVLMFGKGAFTAFIANVKNHQFDQ